MNNNFLSTIFGSCPIDMSDADIMDAMKSIPGYLDITPDDFKEIFRCAYRHAVERLAKPMAAKDIMSVELISVTQDTSLKETAVKMATHGISGVPVTDGRNTVVGIISEKDFLFYMGERKTRSTMDVIAQCLSGKSCVAMSMRNGAAKDIMTSPALTVSENTPVFEIAAIFTEKSINRVPVTDKDGHLLGIVARSDIFKAACVL